MSSPSRLVIDPAMYTFSELAQPKKKNLNGQLPPASKLLPTASPLPGWTPLISRTFSNEIMSYNSTPSSKVLPSLYKQNNAGQQNQGEYDYTGLNLTPFLTHNINLMNNPNSAGNLSNNINFTPYYEKSMHLADFFMESPIRQTPQKLETITPSKFSMQQGPLTSSKNLGAKLNSALSLKRSITQIDTPARHPFKKYDVSFKDDENHSESEDEAEGEQSKNFNDNFVTPSKRNVLKETSGNLLNKTPSRIVINDKAKNLYQTPAKPTLVSSPSTVIMSSATRSPDNEAIKQIPPSPTPLKDRIEVAEPVMGIFSEKKPMETKPIRKQKKQLAGMNRFQIVFTDVHTLMNSKKKKGTGNNLSAKNDMSEKKRAAQPLPRQDQTSPPQMFTQQNPPSFTSFQHTLSSLSASQDYNSTVNTSREFSVLANNSTVNTTNSNLNVTSDQSSFELMHGGLMSTPNGKFLLDNSFERPSPQPMNHMANPMGVVQQMPPPPKTHQHGSQQRHDPNQSMVMNMTMSTPQHENIINGHPCAYGTDEMSPSNKNSMAYMYQQLHQFHHMNSPGNVNTLQPQAHQHIEVESQRYNIQEKSVAKAAGRKPRSRGKRA